MGGDYMNRLVYAFALALFWNTPAMAQSCDEDSIESVSNDGYSYYAFRSRIFAYLQ
jgi:hypothetical protein